MTLPARLALIVMLLVAQRDSGAAPPSSVRRAHSDPRPSADAATHVVAYRLERWVDGELCRDLAQGVVRNISSGLRALTSVHMLALVEPGGAIVADGYGTVWLPVLAPGEASPFFAATGQYLCDTPIGSREFEMASEPTVDDRYRGLAVTGIVERQVEGRKRLFGEMVNTGTETLNAGDSETGVLVGFWQGPDLVKLVAPRWPAMNTPGEVGQPHPPGRSYPWWAAAPEQPYDRVETWARGRPYPHGIYPVPLQVGVSSVTRLDGGLHVRAVLANCGVEPARDVVVLLAARDADGLVLGFAHGALDLERPLAPGDRRWLSVEWGPAPPAAPPSGVSMLALALQTQVLPPDPDGCRIEVAEVCLPRVLR